MQTGLPRERWPGRFRRTHDTRPWRSRYAGLPSGQFAVLEENEGDGERHGRVEGRGERRPPQIAPWHRNAADDGHLSLELRTSIAQAPSAAMIALEVGPRIECRLPGGMTLFIDGKAEAQ